MRFYTAMPGGGEGEDAAANPEASVPETDTEATEPKP